MICVTCRGRGFVACGGADDDEGAEHGPCPDCIGGIASCCDAAGAITFAASNEGEKSNAPSFTCPRCGAVSYNLNDVRERYCGRCHLFEADMPKAGMPTPVRPVSERWRDVNYDPRTDDPGYEDDD